MLILDKNGIQFYLFKGGEEEPGTYDLLSENKSGIHKSIVGKIKYDNDTKQTFFLNSLDNKPIEIETFSEVLATAKSMLIANHGVIK